MAFKIKNFIISTLKIIDAETSYTKHANTRTCMGNDGIALNACVEGTRVISICYYYYYGYCVRNGMPIYTHIAYTYSHTCADWLNKTILYQFIGTDFSGVSIQNKEKKTYLIHAHNICNGMKVFCLVYTHRESIPRRFFPDWNKIPYYDMMTCTRHMILQQFPLNWMKVSLESTNWWMGESMAKVKERENVIFVFY